MLVEVSVLLVGGAAPALGLVREHALVELENGFGLGLHTQLAVLKRFGWEFDGFQRPKQPQELVTGVQRVRWQRRGAQGRSGRGQQRQETAALHAGAANRGLARLQRQQAVEPMGLTRS